MARSGVWLIRLAAVALGVAVMSGSIGSASAWVNYPKPDLSKKPRLEHLMNQDFGTKGVKVRVRALGYDSFADNPWESENGSVYDEVRLEIRVSGFNGPVTVWGRSAGSAGQQGTRQPWKKIVAKPVNGKVVIALPVARIFHCATIDLRINDNDGRWTKAFTAVRVREAPEPYDSNGGTIDW